MVFFVKVPVVFVRLFSELFVEACSRFWLRFCESRFYRGGQVIARSIHNVRPRGRNRGTMLVCKSYLCRSSSSAFRLFT